MNIDLRKPAAELIETTAGQVAAELKRRGIAADRRILVAVEPDDWLSQARKSARTRVVAEALTDDDIDRLIEEERDAVQPLIASGNRRILQ